MNFVYMRLKRRNAVVSGRVCAEDDGAEISDIMLLLLSNIVDLVNHMILSRCRIVQPAAARGIPKGNSCYASGTQLECRRAKLAKSA